MQINRLIADKINEAKIPFEKEHGNLVDYPLDSEKGKEIANNLLINIVEPIMFSAVGSILTLFAKLDYPKDFLMKEIAAFYDTCLIIAENEIAEMLKQPKIETIPINFYPPAGKKN